MVCKQRRFITIIFIVICLLANVSNGELIFKDDFESALDSWTITAGNVTQDTSVVYQGSKSLKVTNGGKLLTRTMDDDVPGDPLGGTYSELWTEFWVYVEDSDWYSSFPMPVSIYDVPAYIMPAAVGTEPDTFRAAVRQMIEGAVYNDILGVYALNNWHHFLIGIKINPVGSVYDGTYSYYKENNGQWTAITEDADADFYIQPAIDALGRIRIWSNSGTMYVDDLKVYNANPLEPGDNSSVTFYCGFEDSVSAQGVDDGQIQIFGGSLHYDTGVRGKGLLTGTGKGYVSYPAPGVLPKDEGTIEFWFKAVDWLANDPQHHKMIEGIGQGWLQIYKYYSGTDLFFLQSERKETWTILYGDLEPVGSQSWRHIVFTWNRDRSVIYYEGQRMWDLTRPQLSAEDFVNFLVGERENSSGSTIIDELYIYDRTLNEQEASWVYQNYQSRQPGGDIPFNLSDPLYVQVRPFPSQDRIEVYLRTDPRIAGMTINGTIELEPLAGTLVQNINVQNGIWQGVINYTSLTPDTYRVKADLVSSTQENYVAYSRDIIVNPEPWRDNSIGTSERPPRPWTPVTRETSGQTKIESCLNREYYYSGGFLPSSIFTQATDVLAGPIEFDVKLFNGSELNWNIDNSAITKINDNEIITEGAASNAIGQLSWKRTFEFDGMVRYDFSLLPAAVPATVDKFEIRFPIKTSCATLWHLYPEYPVVKDGLISSNMGIVYNYNWACNWWLGTEDVGLAGFCESDQAWMDVHSNGFYVERKADSVDVVWNFIAGPKAIDKTWDFTFGIQATPVKPIPQNHRTWRMYPSHNAKFALTWPNPIRDTYYGYPEPLDIDQYKSFVKGFNDQGVSVAPYSLLNSLADAVPEWSYYGEEWFSGNVYFNDLDVGAFDQCLMNTLPVNDYIDFMVWSNDKFLREVGLNGLYHDFSWAKPTTAIEKGFGYLRDGQIQPVTPIFGVREFYKKMYTMMQDYEKDLGETTYMIGHTSYPLMVPIAGFCDVYVTGEQYIGKVTDNYLDATDLDVFRSQHMGHNYGTAGMFLPEFRGSYQTSEEPTKRMMGLILLHDMMLWPSWCNRTVVNQIFDAVDEAGIGNAEFLPYWNNTNVIGGQDASIKCSVYKKEFGGAVLCIVNTTRNTVNRNISVDLNTIECSGNPFADDILNVISMQLQGNSLSLQFDPLEMKLIHIYDIPDFCGDYGTIYLEFDKDKNCYVDLADITGFAENWLETTDPQN